MKNKILTIFIICFSLYLGVLEFKKTSPGSLEEIQSTIRQTELKMKVLELKARMLQREVEYMVLENDIKAQNRRAGEIKAAPAFRRSSQLPRFRSSLFVSARPCSSVAKGL